MNNKQIKFENPIRIEELKPSETLRRIGVKENHVICDIGAGSGIFTIPAAKLTKETVYALEIDDEMLALISDKAEKEDIKNIHPIKVNNSRFDVPNKVADIVFLVTVLHEIKEKTVFLSEIKRVLKEDGKIAIIEFHKRQTPMGPPIGHRLGKEGAMEVFNNVGLIIVEEFDLGPNYYCSVFSNETNCLL